jgi:hypothetical protein
MSDEAGCGWQFDQISRLVNVNWANPLSDTTPPSILMDSCASIDRPENEKGAFTQLVPIAFGSTKMFCPHLASAMQPNIEIQSPRPASRMPVTITMQQVRTLQTQTLEALVSQFKHKLWDIYRQLTTDVEG